MQRFSACTLILLLAGCDPAEPERPPLGDPIQAPLGTWTWIDFPDSTCDDGSPTGLGVNLSPSGKKDVLVFLNGGGACWDYSTCLVLNTAAHGPFGASEFFAMQGRVTGSILDRALPGNPFADWNYFFVPYCTGDVHGGDNVAMYGPPGGTLAPYYHKGRSNMAAFLPRIAGTFPTPGKVVLTGSSAGGFGAAFNYDLARPYFPRVPMYLVDDSGPPLIGDAVPYGFRDAWFRQWRIDLVLDPLCGTACRDDLAALIPALVRRYPRDRAALLSTTRDPVISAYYLKSFADFEMGLYDLAAQVIDPLATFRYFIVSGNTHTLLPAPQNFQAADGTSLTSWLTQMVTDDPGWSSRRP